MKVLYGRIIITTKAEVIKRNITIVAIIFVLFIEICIFFFPFYFVFFFF